MDFAGRAGRFDEAFRIQKELESVKELVFSEPIVEAVARIKAVLHYEGLIKTATVRRPQLGISEAEKKHCWKATAPSRTTSSVPKAPIRRRSIEDKNSIFSRKGAETKGSEE